MTTREHLSDTIKKQVAGRQLYKCANNKEIELIGLKGYKCPRWYSTYHNGDFDEAGYDIDHIEEYCLTQDHNIENLQALCKSCHSVKTKRFMSGKKHTKKKVKVDKKMDIYERFLDECTEEKKGEKIKTCLLYPIFKEWVTDNNYGKPIGRNNFIKEINKHVKNKMMRIDNTTTFGIKNRIIKIDYLDEL